MGIPSELRHAILFSIEKYKQSQSQHFASGKDKKTGNVSESESSMATRIEIHLNDNPEKWDVLEVTIFLSRIKLDHHIPVSY
jgi:hypothetical protein